MLKEGERFFCDAETALKWRNNMPFSDKAYPRIVFAPLSRWSEVGTPDLVYVFANADQISALVTMQGFHNGKAVNTSHHLEPRAILSSMQRSRSIRKSLMQSWTF